MQKYKKLGTLASLCAEARRLVRPPSGPIGPIGPKKVANNTLIISVLRIILGSFCAEDY